MLRHAAFSRICFYTLLLAVLAFFAWSRYDSSEKVYFFGDGNLAVEMVELMLREGDRDANWHRLAGRLQVPEALQKYAPAPDPQGHFYNMSGYFVLATHFTSLLPDRLSLNTAQSLRLLNVLLQTATLLLLALIARQWQDRWLALIALLFYVAFPLAMMEAHYERTEALLTFLATLLLYGAFLFGRRPFTAAVLMGIALGLSLASKISQLYLGLVPALLFASVLWRCNAGQWLQQVKQVLLQALVLLAALLVSIYLTVPFILEHPLLYLDEVRDLMAIQQHPETPYLIENYSMLQQWRITVSYFVSTLGAAWLVLLAAGALYACRSWQGRLVAVPVIFLVLYLGQYHSFFERNFSALIPYLCLLAALPLAALCRKYPPLLLLALLVALPSLQLSHTLVTRFFHGNDYQQRQAFQNQLKEDFHGYWVKSIDDGYVRHAVLPTVPDGKPRIYVVEDFNHPSVGRYLQLLSDAGYVRMGEYRSDFYGMVPNNITIYHEAGAYHYFVRRNDWPSALAQDYFKTNRP